MIRKMIAAILRFLGACVFIIIGIGISSTISMSNTRKITASRKNRDENGIRAVRDGSNPHSNADDFSRSLIDFK